MPPHFDLNVNAFRKHPRLRACAPLPLQRGLGCGARPALRPLRQERVAQVAFRWCVEEARLDLIDGDPAAIVPHAVVDGNLLVPRVSIVSRRMWEALAIDPPTRGCG